MEEIALEHWAQFGATCDELFAHRDALKSDASGSVSPLVFRGQGNTEWGLRDTLERAVRRPRVSVLQYFETALAVRSEISTFTGHALPAIPAHACYAEFLSKTDTFPLFEYPAYEYFIYLRHHGFPSPLLDWTRSPYIAAFFAFEEMPSDADRVAVFAFLEYAGAGKVGSMQEPRLTVRGPYVKAHRRHFLQQAEYSICTLRDENAYFYVPHELAFEKERDEQDIRYKITLPAGERDIALKDLARMNISAFTLFQSEEGLVRSIGRREFGSERYDA